MHLNNFRDHQNVVGNGNDGQLGHGLGIENLRLSGSSSPRPSWSLLP
jgi:hypothetical protein